MSFWEKLISIARDNDDYGDEDELDYDGEDFADEAGFDTEPEERAPRTRRTPNFGFSTAEPAERSAAPERSSAFGGNVVSMGNKQEVVLFHPANFNDTSTAADHLRSKKAVIVNMENVDRAMARRVVDFLSGCAYALDGKVKKVAQSTYLFCPHNMEIHGDLENLQSEVESYI